MGQIRTSRTVETCKTIDAIDAGRKSGKLEERGPYPNAWVMARRITEDEYLIMEKLEYVDGRIMTGPGIELFVGVHNQNEET